MRSLYNFQYALIVVSTLLGGVAQSATESVLGDVKVVKITQQVSLSACQESFQVKDYISFCKVPVWTPADTDLLVSMNEAATIKIPHGADVSLRASLVTNVEGYYWFTFERKASDGMPQSAPTYSQVFPVMQNLVAQLENGEVYWKLYRLK